jgi:DNA-binding NarL/FixJ family response regulator
MTETTNSKGSSAPTIVIADDHEIYRRGLTLFLEHEGMNVIDYAATGRQAVIATIKHHPDVLVLDIAMPDIDGLIALTILKFLVPDMRIVVLTALPDSIYLSRAHELGADGYFSKGVDNNLLAEFVRKLTASKKSSNGQNYGSGSYNPTGAGPILAENGKDSSNGRELTGKEISILKLISKGYKNQEIADQLAVSNDALKTQLQDIFSKIAVTKNNQSPTYGLLNEF